MKFIKYLREVVKEIGSNLKLYEISAWLLPDGEIDENSTITIAFGLENGSLVVHNIPGSLNYTAERHSSPWLEDRPITPYLPGPERYLKLAGIDGQTVRVTLRHQLCPQNIEPQYIFKTAGGEVFVGIWSGDIE